MVAPGMLQNPSVKRWLGGVEPAWTLLDQASFAALREPPSPTAGPIRLAADLTQEEVEQSAVARNALILLQAAAADPGLKMTATGNLSRGVVADMCDRFSWTEFDKASAFQFHKVINEPDFLLLYFVRHIAQTGTLLRKHKGHLKISPAGRRMLQPPNPRALQAVLFHITMWHFDLGNLGWGLHGWPQRDAGVILWSLSIASNDWQPRERLSRLCTIPINGVLDQTWDTASHAMEARILRPLQWFGLLEHREDGTELRRSERPHLYRKTVLFDRFLSFDVTLEHTGGLRH
jgi:hypothetical protein